jgi:hypothetical protein
MSTATTTYADTFWNSANPDAITFPITEPMPRRQKASRKDGSSQ